MLKNPNEYEAKRLRSKGLLSLRQEFVDLLGISCRYNLFYFPNDAEFTIDSNSVLLSGQCLVKDYEDAECPITLADALFTETFLKLSEKFERAIVFYPDDEYKKFSGELKIRSFDSQKTEAVINGYSRFHSNTLSPHIKRVRTSEFKNELDEFRVRHRDLEEYVKLFYGWKAPSEVQKKVVYEYAIDEVVLPSLIFGKCSTIYIFAYPDEICSVEIAQELLKKTYRLADKIILISSLPIKGINSKKDMVDAGRPKRIHLNESRDAVRNKLSCTMLCNTTTPDEDVAPSFCELFYIIRNSLSIPDYVLDQINQDCPFAGELCQQTALDLYTHYQSLVRAT